MTHDPYGTGHGSPMSWATILPNLSSLRPSVLDLGSGIGQTDGQTDDGHQCLCPILWGGCITNYCSSKSSLLETFLAFYRHDCRKHIPCCLWPHQDLQKYMKCDHTDWSSIIGKITYKKTPYKVKVLIFWTKSTVTAARISRPRDCSVNTAVTADCVYVI